MEIALYLIYKFDSSLISCYSFSKQSESIMEYVSGEDFKSLIKRVKQLTVGTAISIAKQVCEGLAEAHRLGVEQLLYMAAEERGEYF